MIFVTTSPVSRIIYHKGVECLHCLECWNNASMGLKKDLWSILFLLLLYFLQGVPLGLSASIPLLLQKYGVSYSQQAVFTMAYHPFSFKVRSRFFHFSRLHWRVFLIAMKLLDSLATQFNAEWLIRRALGSKFSYWEVLVGFIWGQNPKVFQQSDILYQNKALGMTPNFPNQGFSKAEFRAQGASKSIGILTHFVNNP